MEKKLPKGLLVETGFSVLDIANDPFWKGLLDYSIYSGVPRAWRKIEELLRLDFYLAWQAKKVASQYDFILAMSEKVGIPLALLGTKTACITFFEYPASVSKKIWLRLLNIPAKWAGVGYISKADLEFITSFYHVSPDRLFRYFGGMLPKYEVSQLVVDGPILSIGVTKRDYSTLFSALWQLPGFQTEIHISSRYGDRYRGNLKKEIPPWVQIKGRVSDEELEQCYHQARFVVIPLVNSPHFTAGSSVALEAGAAGKAIIATRTPGMPSFVIDGVTGLLVPPGDSQALKEAIQKLWNDPNLAHRMGMAGREFVQANYNSQEINQGILAYICKVCPVN